MSHPRFCSHAASVYGSSFETADVVHGFGIIGWNLNKQAVPGQPLVIDLQPEQTGRFQIVCTVLCGMGHSDHKGWIVVEEP